MSTISDRMLAGRDKGSLHQAVRKGPCEKVDGCAEVLRMKRMRPEIVGVGAGGWAEAGPC